MQNSIQRLLSYLEHVDAVAAHALAYKSFGESAAARNGSLTGMNQASVQLVTNGVLRYFISLVCTMLDPASGDRASLDTIRAELEKPDLLDAICKNPWPTASTPRDRERLARWGERVTELMQSDAWQRIRRYRDKDLSHMLLPNHPLDHPDMRIQAEDVIYVHEKAQRLVRDLFQQFGLVPSGERDLAEFRAVSDHFWLNFNRGIRGTR